jgi:hypothetical protein
MRHSVSLAAWCWGLAVLAGCGGGGAVAAPAPAFAPLPANALLYYDNSGGIQDSLRLVIREEASYRDIWGRATSTQSSPPPAPAIDFGREMLVVAAGGRMTPEDVISIDSVTIREDLVAPNRRERVMDVVVHTVRGCRAFTTDAYPLAIIRVRRFDGEVRFTERRLRADGC